MKKKIIKIISILLVLVWMGLIFYFSHQDATESSGLSNSFIASIYSFLTGKEATKEIIEKYSFFTRKLAHFSVYFVLGLLVYNCMNVFNVKKDFIYSLLICFLYATSDEIHQRFVPGRACQFRDILIDTSGALLAILILYIVKYLTIKHIEKKRNI